MEYIVYILHSGIKKHDTLFKHKATNILESSLNLFDLINSQLFQNI